MIEAADLPMPLQPPQQGERLFAAVTASAEDCLAYHVILERGAALPNLEPTTTARISTADRNEQPGQWQIVRLAAGSLPDLAAAAGAAVANAPALFAKNSSDAFPADAAWRLALVVDSAEALAAKLRLAADQLANPQSRVVLEEQGIFCHERPQKPAQSRLFVSGARFAICRHARRLDPPELDRARRGPRGRRRAGLARLSELRRNQHRRRSVARRRRVPNAVGHAAGRHHRISHALRSRHPAGRRQRP